MFHTLAKVIEKRLETCTVLLEQCGESQVCTTGAREALTVQVGVGIEHPDEVLVMRDAGIGCGRLIRMNHPVITI